MRCLRCGGRVFQDPREREPEPYCLACGYRLYETIDPAIALSEVEDPRGRKRKRAFPMGDAQRRPLGPKDFLA